MKKKFINAMLASIGTILLLTSCLGDSDNSTTVDRTYAYIRSNELNTTKIAQAGPYPVSNDALKSSNLQVGDCAIIGFKINLSNISSSNEYYVADYINLPANEDQIFRRNDQTQSWLTVVDTTYTGKEIYFDYLPTASGASASELVMYNAEVMGYRWFMSYKYTKKKSETAPKLTLYFDKDKQVNLDKSALKEGEIILDFRLERQGSPSTNPQEESKAEVVTNVINFTNMIDHLDSTVPDGKTKTYNLRFRYFKKVENPKSGEPAYKLAITSNYVTSLTFDKTKTEK